MRLAANQGQPFATASAHLSMRLEVCPSGGQHSRGLGPRIGVSVGFESGFRVGVRVGDTG